MNSKFSHKIQEWLSSFLLNLILLKWGCFIWILKDKRLLRCKDLILVTKGIWEGFTNLQMIWWLSLLKEKQCWYEYQLSCQITILRVDHCLMSKTSQENFLRMIQNIDEHDLISHMKEILKQNLKSTNDFLKSSNYSFLLFLNFYKELEQLMH